MKRILSIASHELFSHLSRRSFRVAVIALPLLFAGALMLGALILWTSHSFSRTIGVVSENADLSPLELPKDSPGLKRRIRLVPFHSVEAATAALRAHSINSFVSLPKAFQNQTPVELYSLEPPDGWFYNRIKEAILFQLFPKLDRAPIRRVFSDVYYEIRQNSQAENPNPEEEHDLQLKILCGFSCFFSVILIFGGAIRLAYAYSEDRNNHSLELLFSSVSPLETLVGKAIGQTGLLLIHSMSNLMILLSVALLYASNAFALPASVMVHSLFAVTLVVSGLFALGITHYLSVSLFVIALSTRCHTYKQCAQLGGVVATFSVFSLFLCFKVGIFVRLFAPLFLAFPLTSSSALMVILLQRGPQAAEFYLAIVATIATQAACLFLAAHSLRGERAFDWRRSRRRVRA